MGDDVEPRVSLDVAVNDVPRRVSGVGPRQHVVPRAGVVHPAIARLQVHGTQLLSPPGIVNALLETLLLGFKGR